MVAITVSALNDKAAGSELCFYWKPLNQHKYFQCRDLLVLQKDGFILLNKKILPPSNSGCQEDVFKSRVLMICVMIMANAHSLVEGKQNVLCLETLSRGMF